MDDPPVTGIERFLEAQDADGEFESALAEIVAGRKQGHWIWYVFPQLSGLGASHMSQRYGIRGREEAVAYLRHPVLHARLLAITTAVARQVRNGIPLTTLMGSSIDAQKLVSSLTLFGSVARSLHAAGTADGNAALASLADEILVAAASEGYPGCAYTSASC
jgi:uncharacterized protein (DUF1810 family)